MTMPDDSYSLIPVDYQPSFQGYSLIPVDHDPFADERGTQQTQAAPMPPVQDQSSQPQPVQPAPAQPAPVQPMQPESPMPPPAAGGGQPNVGAPNPDDGPGGSGGIAGIKRFGGAEGGDFPSRNAGIGFESAERAWDAAAKEMRDLGTQYYPEEAKSRRFIPELGVEIFKRDGQYYYDRITRGYQDGRLGGGVGFGDSGAVARGHMHWDNQLEDDPDRDNARAYSRQAPDYKAWVGSWDGAYLYWYNGKPTGSRMPDWNRYKY